MSAGAPKFHLYQSLGVSRESSVEEITRAYRKLALQYHPDRNPDGVEQFKAISNAYAILSDVDRRAVYDLTGFVSDAAGEAGAAHGMSDAAARQQRSAELADQVRNFFATYAGSPEEAADVVKGYHTCDGNFKKMVREYLLFDNGAQSEVQRLHRLVEKLIAKGSLKATASWTETTTPRSILKIERAMRREREEAEEALKELAGSGADEGEDGGLGALQLAIRQRQASSYSSMLDKLEAKYVTRKNQSSSGKRPRKAEAEKSATRPRDRKSEAGLSADRTQRHAKSKKQQ